MIKKAYILLLICCCCIACGPSILYQHQVRFENQIWSYDDTVKTTFEISDTTQNYNIVAVLSHTDEYPFENLYLKIHTSFPSSEIVSDQISIPMADKFGRWLGDCGSTDCDLEIMLQENVKFNEIGTHQIEFEQFTRSESLKGICALAFKIELVD